MTMNPFEQSRQQLLHYLTSNAEQEVIDYIRQEIQHDAPDSVPTAEELLTFFRSPDTPTELDTYQQIIPKLGDIKLDKLTTIQIQKFYNDLQKNGRVQRYKHIELKNKGLSVRVSLKNGVDVKTLSGALGHYSAGFTLSTYTHATAEMKRDAADTIGNVISQAM